MTGNNLIFLLAGACFLALSFSGGAANAFSVVQPAARSFKTASPSSHLFQAADAWSRSAASGGGSGAIEQIEFKIYPDGRVEEIVRGVKGNNCHKVTEKINEALGEVVASEPTAEMFEEEVVVEETLYNKESTSGGDSSWDGSSSW